MTSVFLSYARSDGAEAAVELRRDLIEMGLEVWRDIEEMRGGLAWREQIRQALAAVDAVLVVLTPGAVASATVAWEWQTALAGGRRTIPLLIQPCEVPAPLAVLHYHDFTRPADRRTALNRLIRDLFDVGATTLRRGDTYAIGELIDSVAGPSGTVINEQERGEVGGGAPAEVPPGEATYRIGRAVGSVVGPDGRVENRSAPAGGPTAEIRRMLDDVLATLTVQNATLIATLDDRLDRLATAQAADVADVLAALESDRIAAADIDALLAQVTAAVAAAQRDGVLSPGAGDTPDPAEWVSAPELSVKHRLMLTVPIVPFLLSYEGELELGQRADLAAAWQRLLGRLRG